MYILIHTTSQTEANRVKRLLSSGGIYASIQKTPFFISRTGCGYCVRVPARDGERAIAALRERRVPYKAVYEVSGGEARRISS
ncbi:MAG: DUF3343 domain-containing protein [Clostridia bacterium]|nr:DUF3343 domain-containing protein [Clostridia bacterium]